MAKGWSSKAIQAEQVFTPRAPISERALFSGRIDQIKAIVDAITQPGCHAVLFGERGVGKTSLANVLASFVQRSRLHVPRVNCDARDTFSTLWKKFFEDLTITETRKGIGFTSTDEDVSRTVLDMLPETLTPDVVRRILEKLSIGNFLVPIFDEFDRIECPETSILMADTIKGLSDYAVDTTVIVIGVAESVDELIKEHQSIERALVQVPMPRMSGEEVSEIINNGLKRLTMRIDESERNNIVYLSQGLPYVTHLLSLNATLAAIARKSKVVKQDDVQQAILASLNNWQQSVKTAYYKATRSPQPGNIFRQVVLACALAGTDEFGFFSAANVRESLRVIVPDRDYGIPHFARHLTQLSGVDRGELLYRTGKKRQFRYRFSGPLIRSSP